MARCRQRIGRINALFTQVQQLWTAVDSFDTPARGRLRERAKSYAKALANDILR
ncbi:hypothetical protein GSM69_30465 [Escherichia coli]|nr:hypothetical protein [Escherichia coli]EFH2719631.1 hypothetical protein [Escherichia coli]EFH2719662.1 hypothetical protein [Escherichia coli]